MANVNVPTNMQQKEKDVNTKLQLYGIYSAFANGKVPSNKQIDIALNSALSSRAFTSPSKKLSAEGQELVTDLKRVINEAKLLLLTKNQGNLIQDFIWEAQNIDGGNASLPGAPVDKATSQQHGQQALDGLKTLGTLILSNGQFRKLISDATVLIRDMAGDAAQNAANKVNPSKDRLNSIDEPAEDNTWHDVPDLSRDNLKSQARSAVDKNKPFSRGEAKNIANESADRAQQQGNDEDAANAGAQHGFEKLKQTAKQNIPDEHQENAQNAKNAAVQSSKNYLDKKMPKERREQTIYRLKKMIVEIQGHPDYQQAIETLLSLAEEYGGHAKAVGQDSTGTVKGAHADNSLQKVEADLKTLIERFANSTSMDDFFDSLNQIYRDADQDPELKNWFKNMDRFVRKCLQEQGYILKDSSTEEWNRIYDKGEFLFRDRYRNHTDRILDELKFLADQFDQDPQNNSFAEAVTKLFLDLGNDESGQSTFKPHLVKDVFEVIIPAIFENTRYVPIPRIEVSDPMADVVVENLVIESDNLFPNNLEFSTDNYFRMGRKALASKRDNKIMIAASGIQCDLRDVAYYIKKKQGFPSITDKGVMDIILAGEGFSFKIAARNAQKTDRRNFFVIDRVDVNVKNLAIKVKQSNHKLLFNLAKPLLLKVMKPVITKVIEKQIKSQFEHWDEVLYGIYKEANVAIERAKKDPENAPNMYQQYVTAIQNKIGNKKKKAEEKAADTKVNVAITKHDSMFKNISLPGGISTKATEYRDLAAKGDKWESPVFGIGSARETSNLPKVAQISRKPHKTTDAVIRGGNHPNASGGGSGSTGTSNFSSNFAPKSSSSDYNTGSTNTGYGTSASSQIPSYSAGSGAPGYSSTGGTALGGNTFSSAGSGAPGYSSTGGTGLRDNAFSSTESGAPGYSSTGGTALGGNTFSNTGTSAQTGTTGFGSQVDHAFNQGPPSTSNTGTGSGHTVPFYDGVTKH